MLGDPADVRTVFTAGPQRTNAGEANEILRPTLGSHRCCCSTATSTCASAS